MSWENITFDVGEVQNTVLKRMKSLALIKVNIMLKY